MVRFLATGEVIDVCGGDPSRPSPATDHRRVTPETGVMATVLAPTEALDWVVAKPTAKLAAVTADGAPHVAPV